MTKKELVAKLVEKEVFKTKVDAEDKVEAMLETIGEALKAGEEVSFLGFGKFEVVQKAERLGRNPKTGEEIKIPAKKVVKFKAGKNILN